MGNEDQTGRRQKRPADVTDPRGVDDDKVTRPGAEAAWRQEGAVLEGGTLGAGPPPRRQQIRIRFFDGGKLIAAPSHESYRKALHHVGVEVEKVLRKSGVRPLTAESVEPKNLTASVTYTNHEPSRRRIRSFLPLDFPLYLRKYSGTVDSAKEKLEEDEILALVRKHGIPDRKRYSKGDSLYEYIRGLWGQGGVGGFGVADPDSHRKIGCLEFATIERQKRGKFESMWKIALHELVHMCGLTYHGGGLMSPTAPIVVSHDKIPKKMARHMAGNLLDLAESEHRMRNP